MMLFNKANRGASGKDATNKVTNPNWITEKKKKNGRISMDSVCICQMHHASAIPPNSNKMTLAGRLDCIFCMKHFCLAAAPFRHLKASCPSCKSQDSWGKTWKVTRKTGKLLTQLPCGQCWHSPYAPLAVQGQGNTVRPAAAGLIMLMSYSFHYCFSHIFLLLLLTLLNSLTARFLIVSCW